MTTDCEKGISTRKQLVFTVKDRCRVCYTCLRECPAKAIKINNGQAEVIHERCIGCGNCVKVCSQDAKVFLKCTDEAEELLNSRHEVVACLAPSFAAEFAEFTDYRTLIGMIRALGFSRVTEVAFGADLVAEAYRKLMTENGNIPHISSDCPAIVFFIEHYYPELVPYLAPIVSPMHAMARVVRRKYGSQVKVVFIGPCIAKKAETLEVDVALTFRELREMFRKKGIKPESVTPSGFDPPHAGRGAVFPISGGLIQTSGITADLCSGDILIAEGRVNIRDAIREFEDGLLSAGHLELLCCEGCIMGPGMSPEGKKFARRSLVSKFAGNKLKEMDHKAHEAELKQYGDINLKKQFTPLDRRFSRPNEPRINEVLHSMGKFSSLDFLNCGACGYDTCEEHAVAIVEGLADNEMCLPYTIEKLHNYIKELNISNEKLASARQALQQSEKLASMGQLSAGIAHELNNPLGVITMYSNILLDEAGKDEQLKNDLRLIVEQADRCKKIVGGLLNFARKNQVNLAPSDVNLLLERSLGSVLIPDNIRISLDSALTNPIAMLDSDQMMQVFTNLIKNAVEAMPEGGELKISTDSEGENISFSIRDSGPGIAKEDMDKLFTPFFTTKGIGKGTGLGLPIVYGIVKMHRGSVSMTSNTDPAAGQTGTEFRVCIPRSAQ